MTKQLTTNDFIELFDLFLHIFKKMYRSKILQLLKELKQKKIECTFGVYDKASEMNNAWSWRLSDIISLFNSLEFELNKKLIHSLSFQKMLQNDIKIPILLLRRLSRNHKIKKHFFTSGFQVSDMAASHLC